jgi:hypothetical protein
VAGNTADGQRPIAFGGAGEADWGVRAAAGEMPPAPTSDHGAITNLVCAKGRSGVGLSRREYNAPDGEAISPGNLGGALPELRWKSKSSGSVTRPGPEGESDTDIPGFSLVTSNGGVAGRREPPEGVQIVVANSVQDGPASWTGFEAGELELNRNRGPSRPSVMIRGSSAAPAPGPALCSTPSPAMPIHSSLVNSGRTG